MVKQNMKLELGLDVIRSYKRMAYEPWTALGEQDYIFTFVYRKRTGEKLHEGGRQLISKIASPCVPLTGGKQNAPGLRLCAGPRDSNPLLSTP